MQILEKEVANQKLIINSLELDIVHQQLAWLHIQVNELNEANDPANNSNRLKLMQFFSSSRYDWAGLTRFGDDNDGGYYVFSSLLNKNQTLISAGLGDDISFEFQISDQIGSIVGLDHTINKIEQLPSNMTHICKALKSNLNENSLDVDYLVKKYPADDFLLKIDVEGDEWEILANMQQIVLRQFSQIIIEFHGFASPISSSKFEIMTAALKNLQDSHSLIHAHPNNYGTYRYFGDLKVPDIIEVLYIRNNELTKITKSKSNLQMPQNNKFFRSISTDWIDDISS